MRFIDYTLYQIPESLWYYADNELGILDIDIGYIFFRRKDPFGQGHQNALYDLIDTSHDGKTMIISTCRNTVEVWDLKKYNYGLWKITFVI